MCEEQMAAILFLRIRCCGKANVRVGARAVLARAAEKEDVA